MVNVNIIGNGNPVGVSSNGELLIRDFDYSLSSFKTIDATNTAFNFYKPRQGFELVITGFVISGNRDVGVNGAILTIYTANAEDSTTTIVVPFEIEVPKSTVLPFIVPNVKINEGVFLNGKSDDTVVRVGMFGYFVPKVS